MAASRRRSQSIAERRERRAGVDDPQVVLDAALRYLEARQRSVAEVRRRLTQAGYRAELIDAAIERLLAIGVLDDEAFARAWVESRDRARPRGEHALRQELRLRGIDRATIDGVLEARRAGSDASERGVDEAAAERLLLRHRRTLARVPDPRARRQRAYALLARQGFDPDTAARASTAFVASLEADGAAEPDPDEAAESDPTGDADPDA